MRKLHLYISLIATALCTNLLAQGPRLPSNAVFIENSGQWEGGFSHKLRINGGSFFFEESGFSLLINRPDDHTHTNGEQHEHGPSMYKEAYALKLRWQNADKPFISQEEKFKHTHNYILGNDLSKWRTDVALSQSLHYYELYSGIGLKYFGNGSDLEYDIEIAPNADPNQIAYKVEGALSLKQEGDILIIETPYGNISERIPLAYQQIDGVTYEVSCKYRIEDQTVRFKLGKYDPQHTLIIDPVLEFSTLTGSSADNFGFTATYDELGNFYAGGIVRANGYPTTAGAIATTYAGGDTDLGITKFNPDGDQVLYSTFIGGNGIDLPHSMVCAPNGMLYILGNTGSSNFPMYNNGYQNSSNGGASMTSTFGWVFPSGSDIFAIRLNTQGGGISGGSFLGGDGADGVNQAIFNNYGDLSRGEIILDEQNNVYLTTSCQSADMDFNGTTAGVSGIQDAIIASFNPDLSTLRWGQLFGGGHHESGYSLKIDNNNKLFLTGSTRSGDLNLGSNSGQAFSTVKGALDGYIARFDANSGLFERASYIGGGSDDQSFFVDIDRSDKIYVFGQTESILPVTPGTYSNLGSNQFVMKLNNDINAQEMYTVVGSGQSKTDLVPTAFLVDDCYNIYLSGWNGRSNITSANSNGSNGNTLNLPTSNDAYQSTTDGSDFYFMVLDRNAQNLVYASYFGGNSAEHVDGGTSRFDPQGIIYQAVCAACGQLGFPTTPGAYSETNGSTNCNLGAIKFDFQASVRAIADFDVTTAFDTACNTLFVNFTNNSINSNAYRWDFGNGTTSTDREPRGTFENFGSYSVKLVATDTVCDISDSLVLTTITHDQGVTPKANFNVNYADCDKTFEARFENVSRGSTNYIWSFGDGTTSTLREPVHFFPSVGIYDVELRAVDSICFTEDVITKQVEFTDTIPSPVASVYASPCQDGSLSASVNNGQAWYEYEWEDDFGRVFTGENPRIVFQNSGFYNIHFMAYDTLCKSFYEDTYNVRVGAIQNEVFVPNAFTPNADNKNEVFQVFGNACTETDRFIIYNRWGQKVFETNRPYTEFWDATIKGKPAKKDVYIYVLKRGSETQRGKITLIR
jgi:gliding motility-associated-like protein